jgi:hypothetical protein
MSFFIIIKFEVAFFTYRKLRSVTKKSGRLGGFRCIFTTKRGLVNYTNGSNKHVVLLWRNTAARGGDESLGLGCEFC